MFTATLTQQSAVFGNHFELLEMCELPRIAKAVTEKQVATKIQQFHKKFTVAQACEQSEIERAARTPLRWTHSSPTTNLAHSPTTTKECPATSIRTLSPASSQEATWLNRSPRSRRRRVRGEECASDEDYGHPWCGRALFSEFYLADFKDHVVHPRPRWTLRIPPSPRGRSVSVPLPVYHGKPGKGLSIQYDDVEKHGPVTLLSVVQGAAGRLLLLVAEGESVPRDRSCQIGNTNSR
jgi:L-arabinose isomerase